jgi:hypothetical protein
MKTMNHYFLRTTIVSLAFRACFVFAQENIEIKEPGDVKVEIPLDGLNIDIDAGKDLTTEKNVKAKENIGFNAGGGTHVKGLIKAGGKISIKSGGNIIIDGKMKGGSDIIIESGGDIDINDSIEGERVNANSGEDINVDADITGRKEVNLTTEGDGKLNVSRDSSLNSPEGKVKLDSENLNMEGTINEGKSE